MATLAGPCSDGRKERKVRRPLAYRDVGKGVCSPRGLLRLLRLLPLSCGRGVTGALLDQVRSFVRRFVVVSDEAADAVALWIAHTHPWDAWQTTPYLAISSPTMRTGKTRLFEVLELLARNARRSSSITPAALYRLIDEQRPTLLLDEVDATGMTSRMRGILNDGYHYGGKVTIVARGIPTDFSTFCPKAFAGIGQSLPATITDRSIPVRLERRMPSEPIEKFAMRRARLEGDPLQAELRKFGEENLEALASAEPVTPDQLNDRAADVWLPLFAIADLAGADWPERARHAALCLSNRDEEQDPGVQILGDLRAVFVDPKMRTAEMLGALRRLDDVAYEGDYRHMTGAALARVLRAFQIKPKTLRFGQSIAKGYERSAFENAWARYVTDQLESAGLAGERRDLEDRRAP